VSLRHLAGLLALALALLSGCSLVPSGSDDGGDGPVKNVDERGLRTDLDPLTKRFPAIGQPTSATWESGTLGDSRAAPGPSTYWIDAVVALEPQVATTLRSTSSDAGPAGPDLVQAVAEEVDGESYRKVALTGPQMWQVDAWLVDDSDVLVISARGQ
jgi:hypothetical protein